MKYRADKLPFAGLNQALPTLKSVINNGKAKILIALGFCLSVMNASAAINVTIQPSASGTEVIATASGSHTVQRATDVTFSNSATIYPNAKFLRFFNALNPATSPMKRILVPDMTCTGTLGTGNDFRYPTAVSITGDEFGFQPDMLMVPVGSVVGSVIRTTGAMSFSGTLASLGFTPGTYSCTWGGGTQSLTVSILSAPAPTVTSISQNSGATTGGTSVTITGTNFTGATGVTIGGVAATNVTVVSATSITATTPAHAAGTASVLVTTPGGTNATNTLYTYVTIPQATLTLTASPNALTATTTTSTLSTSGGAGTGAISYAMTAGTCTLSGSTVTAGSATETCTVTATKAADSTYAAATATVSITVSRRATLAAAANDASVAKSQGAQLMQPQKFVQTQVQNITSHLDSFRHSFNLMPSNMGVSINTPSMGPMSPLFYKIKDVWSGNSGESTTSSLRKVGMKDAAQSNTGEKLYNDYNNPEEIDEQAAIEQRIYAYERKQETYSFWSAGTIDTGLFKTGDNKDVTNKFRVNGLTFGLDYKAGPRTIIGAAIGVGQGSNSAQELDSKVKSTQQSFTGYGMLGFGDNWVVDGLLGYSRLSFSGDRTTSDGAATLGMNRTGDSTFASSSISKTFSFGALRVAPFLREDVTHIRLNQYNETGPADYALGYDTARYTTTATSAGLHFSNDIYLDRSKLTTSAKLSTNRMRTGSLSQDVYYADTGMAGGIYTLQQSSSYQNSRSLSLGIMYSNKAGDGIDIGWMGALGANQYRLNGVRFGARFAM